MDHLDISMFEELYKTYYANLCTYANRYVQSKNIAEDIVSETFYKLWESREKINKINHIKGYLFKSVHNNCLYFLRNRDSHPTINDFDFSLLDVERASSKDTMDSLMIKELGEMLEVAISKLSAQQQKVFKLKRFENKKNAEIAEELNISIKTVEMHMSKAVKCLKKDLKNILPSFIIAIILGGF